MKAKGRKSKERRIDTFPATPTKGQNIPQFKPKRNMKRWMKSWRDFK